MTDDWVVTCEKLCKVGRNGFVTFHPMTFRKSIVQPKDISSYTFGQCQVGGPKQFRLGQSWISLAEGDEGLHRPNCQLILVIVFKVLPYRKCNSLPLGPKQPSHPSTNEIHGLVNTGLVGTVERSARLFGNATQWTQTQPNTSNIAQRIPRLHRFLQRLQCSIAHLIVNTKQLHMNSLQELSSKSQVTE